MAGIFSFKCSSCGVVHEGSPSFSFEAPSPYLEQSEEIKARGKLGTDLCHYEDDEGHHYFVRVLLEIPIHGVSESFLWGVWSSLSKESFAHYVETYENPDLEKTYFGWLCNYLPHYKGSYAFASDVHPRANGTRPYITLHEKEHELFHDFKNGISIEKAQTIAELCLHG